jgi:hypothetical protein
MGIIEYLAEIKRQEAVEEGRRQGATKATRRVVKNLLKDSSFSLEKIASLVEAPLEVVKKVSIMCIIEELAQIKRQEVLNECRASYCCEDYTARYARSYIKSYKAGLQDGMELVIRRFVESLLMISCYSIEEVASLADVSLEKVRKIKEAL